MTINVVKGVVLVEGSFPVDHLNPALKHLMHYGDQSGDAGILDWLSMFCFERKNKQVKSWVRSTAHPLSSLANHTELDIVAKLHVFSGDETDHSRPKLISLTVPTKRCALSDNERNDLGVTSFCQFKAFRVATVLGVHFRGGEWGERRCGSVITTIKDQVSRYCIVNRFLEVEGQAYASVTWLSPPTYPCFPFKLVVRVRMLTPQQQRQHRSVLPVDRIVPTTVAVLPHDDGVHYYMLREKGTDRCNRVV